MSEQDARMVLALQTLAIAYRLDGQLEVAQEYERQAIERMTKAKARR